MNVREDVNRELTHKLLISRSSVRSRDGPPFKTMGYEIILIAYFVYVLAMYSLAVKEFQLYLFMLIEWFRCLLYDDLGKRQLILKSNQEHTL